jgi:hypothetical protein
MLMLPEPRARQFVKLWRNLPTGTRKKCCAPAFRLRFFSEQTVLLDVSVCWHCHTIGMVAEGESDYIGFDASASAPQKLLALLVTACDRVKERSLAPVIPVSEIVVLTVVGLTFGGVFLVRLLIGDWKEAKRAAQEKARREQLAEASREREGVWPPPPNHLDT